MSENNRKYEAWALVTGAASGMGRLYVKKLASMGYNVMAVDINAEKLEETAAETRALVASGTGPSSQYRDNFRFLPVVQDLSKQEAASNLYDKAKSEGCDIEVLVNNAGMMFCQVTVETPPNYLHLIMMLHMYTPMMICRLFVPDMQKRGCGYVLNISSLAAWMPWPGIGMYGNTKRFVKGFSRSLRVECRGTGVSVTNAYFGAVDTPLVPLPPKYRKLARNLQVMISPEKAVSKALQATFKRRKGTMPGFLNHIFKPFIIILPDWFLSWALKTLGPIICGAGIRK
ncbi:MAG: SDR family NAD(P)-dependent oxidoreductase [Candidatus Cryptobacteroides sp.]